MQGRAAPQRPSQGQAPSSSDWSAGGTQAGGCRGERHRAKPGLKAVIVAGRPSPARGASPWQRGASRSRLPGRRQEAVRAGGFWETAVSGVCASAADSEAAAVPEPEVCAGVREGLRGAGRGAAGRGGSQRRTPAGPPSGPGGAGRRLRARPLRRGGRPEGRVGLCTLRWPSFPASSATLAFPLPHQPVLFYFEAQRLAGSSGTRLGRGRGRAGLARVLPGLVVPPATAGGSAVAPPWTRLGGLWGV